MIPKTSDYDSLYDTYTQKLEGNGYTVTTTKEEFTSPTYPNGNPSGGYLVLNATGKKKYQVTIAFQSQAGLPRINNPTGEAAPDVFMAIFGLSANTR